MSPTVEPQPVRLPQSFQTRIVNDLSALRKMHEECGRARTCGLNVAQAESVIVRLIEQLQAMHDAYFGRNSYSQPGMQRP